MGDKVREVWIDWGDMDPQKYEFTSPARMDGFIAGAQAAGEALGLSIVIGKTQEEVLEIVEEDEERLEYSEELRRIVEGA